MKKELHKYCLRADKPAYIVFSIIWGIPLALSLFSLANLNTGAWKLTVISLCLLAISLIWLRSFKLLITDDSITYSNVFFGTKKLLWTEVKKSEIKIGCADYMDRLRPTTRLIIEPKDSVEKPPIIINLKVFNSREINILLDKMNIK